MQVLKEGDKSARSIMEQLELKDRRNFNENYLQPTIALGLAEMTIPDKPKSKNQSYRLTEKGKN